MRIAMISSPRTAHTAGRTAGLERMVGDLCAALEELGHDVTRFHRHERMSGPGQSGDTLADPYLELAHASSACSAIRHADPPFDVVHTHIPAVLPFARFIDAPAVCSVHHGVIEGMEDYYARFDASALVMVSNAQAALFARLPRTVTIQPGLDPALYPLAPGDGGYVVYVGGFHRTRAPAEAVDAACAAGARLLFAGTDTWLDHEHEAELDTEDHRRDSDSLRASWPVPQTARIDLLGYARALIVPQGAGEPTVITALEAMLCGTPVIVAPGIGASDLVEPGVSGFVADGYQSLVESLRAVRTLRRSAVRDSASARFGHDRMARAHAMVYERAIDRYRANGARPSLVVPDAGAM